MGKEVREEVGYRRALPLKKVNVHMYFCLNEKDFSFAKKMKTQDGGRV